MVEQRRRSWFRSALAICGHAAMLLLLVAAASKLSDIRQFASDLGTWTLIPPFLHAPVSLGIPLIEGGAALDWFLGLARPTMLSIAAALLAAFTAGYAAQALLVGPPKCGCFGVMFRHEQTVELAWILVARNVVHLAVLLAGGSYALRTSQRGKPELASAPPPATPRVPDRSGARPHAGFTIIELLILIAMIALVVSLTLPSLARVRVEAQQVKSLANLRTHAMTHSAYAGENEDSLLYVSDPLATSTILRGGGFTEAIPYFGLFATWSIALSDSYYGGSAIHESFGVPWKPLNPPFTNYLYGDCFIARPEYWNAYTRRTDTTQLRRTLLSEIQFPSAKGLIFERGWVVGNQGAFEISRDSRIALTDGSARELWYGEFLPAYFRGSPLSNGGWGWGIPVMHTVDGVHGRDLP